MNYCNLVGRECNLPIDWFLVSSFNAISCLFVALCGVGMVNGSIAPGHRRICVVPQENLHLNGCAFLACFAAPARMEGEVMQARSRGAGDRRVWGQSEGCRCTKLPASRGDTVWAACCWQLRIIFGASAQWGAWCAQLAVGKPVTLFLCMQPVRQRVSTCAVQHT